MKKNIFLSVILLTLVNSCTTTTVVNVLPSPSISPTSSVSPLPSPTPNMQKGTLQGKLTIGPLCPVEPCNISDDQKRQAYEARKIQVYTKDKNTLVAETTADYKTGQYSIILSVGIYSLTVANAGIRGFQPKDITIEYGKVTTQDLNIDTGIR
ncbi:MAG: hypothetical protein H7263_06785 [Candidatus Sericytochromatia bacterium]|nr:hypothetical protein [Candidatus Sericytochromatia bacterium]